MKTPLKKIQDELWEHCRRLVYERDNIDGVINCYTCGAADLQGSNKQLGHGPWPKSVLSAFLKYDLRVLHYQCSACNIWHGGMGAEYYKRLSKELGKKGMAQLERDRQVTVKASDHYIKLLNEYEKIV
jgi:hypothetical protein